MTGNATHAAPEEPTTDAADAYVSPMADFLLVALLTLALALGAGVAVLVPA